MSKSIQLKNNENEKMYPHPYYPVGSIYLSVNDINPSKWFGGTWEQIAKGRTLVGVDTSDTDFNTVKKTGGSKTVLQRTVSTDYGVQKGGPYLGEPVLISNNGKYNIIQPYFTCYIWCRTA